MTQKSEYLVVDTSAFIKNVPLQDLSSHIITIEDVIREIRSRNQLKRLVVLPYDLEVKDDVASENISFVTEFSKKTGDYPNLSATDIKVIALTYQLEKELVGENHLKKIPDFKVSKTVTFHDFSTEHSINYSKEVGFYNPDSDENYEQSEELDSDSVVEKKSDVYQVADNLCNKVNELNLDENLQESDVDEDDDIFSDESCGWITPDNISLIKDHSNLNITEDEFIKVACLTTDFAMQNVLQQIGLSVMSLDGLVIKEVCTWIFRCYSCFKTTTIMTKVFCPNCGNKTLKRVQVKVDSDGKHVIHINSKKKIPVRGKRYSLPKPQGGKHGLNPHIYEGQRFPEQRLSKQSLKKLDPLKEDYVSGYSPFALRDVTSKSAMLGLHRVGQFKNWMQKNPNVVMKNRKKK